MRLVLVRHAEAAAGDPDELRPLTSRGLMKALALGARLADYHPQAVLTSPLLRARETGEAIARAAGVEAVTHRLLAPGATTNDVLRAVAGQGETVVVVGHNPDCERVARDLAPGKSYDFRPGGAAVIDVET